MRTGNFISMIIFAALSATAQHLQVDSVMVDTVWNSDSSWYTSQEISQQRNSRDLYLSFKPMPVGGGMAQCFVTMTFDSGKAWVAVSDSFIVLDSGLSSLISCGTVGRVKLRVLGQDRPGVAFRITAQQWQPVIAGNPQWTTMGTTTALTPGASCSVNLQCAPNNTQGLGYAPIVKVWWDAFGTAGTWSDSTAALSYTWNTTVPAGASGQTRAMIAKARDANSLWSAPCTLTVQFGLLAPGRPLLSLPLNNAMGQNITPSFAWAASQSGGKVSSYAFQISTNSGFSTTVWNESGITGMSPAIINIPLLFNTTYFWQINASNLGGTSAWSSVWSFSTLSGVPLLSIPSNASNDILPNLTLSWNSVNGAAGYHAQLSTNGAFNTTVVDNLNLTGVSLPISSLSFNTIYYWRANASSGGSAGAWSSVWSFTTFKLPTMVSIPAGTFQMGDSNTNFVNIAGSSASMPVHSVTLGAFTMSQTLITQEQYMAVVGTNPSYFDSGRAWPVEQVSWFDAARFCNALSKLAGLDTVYTYSGVMDTSTALAINYTKNGYRLPTEAEYEYANRAGTTTDYYWGRNYPPATTADTLAIDSNAVWYYNSPNGTQPVASKKPNAWGLYDMSGNLWEWCNDWYGSYSATSQTNPTGPTSGSSRVLRGGSCVQRATPTICARRTASPTSILTTGTTASVSG